MIEEDQHKTKYAEALDRKPAMFDRMKGEHVATLKTPKTNRAN